MLSFHLRAKLGKFACFRFAYRFLREVSLLRYRFLSKVLGKQIVHFLHVGKTGGTAIKSALGNRVYFGENNIIISHPHSFSMSDSVIGEKCFFFVRDPVDRFVSSFYSRKRKGLPRIYVEWSPEEQEAFDKFETPNELAEALSSRSSSKRRRAVRAMKSIIHVNSSYWDWFVNERYFLNRLGDVIFVGLQRRLNSEFSRLKSVLNLPSGLSLPRGDVNSHRSPAGLDKHLSRRAVRNLKKWYSADYDFLKLLKKKKLIVGKLV